jgi:SNF2 family DNA or RNA helicase
MSMKYRWRTTPYHHQVAAVKQALRQLYKTGGFALLMEPRTGKTKVAIDLAGIMHQKGDVQRVLVVCPINVMDVWIREIRHHFPFKCRITVWDKLGRKELVLPRWNSTMEFVIVNYDAFSAPGRIRGREPDVELEDGTVVRGAIIRSNSRGGRYDMKKKLRQWQPQLMVLDESHRIKTPSSRKTRTLWSIAWLEKRTGETIALVPYRLALTGTVLTKKKRIFDIWTQWKFVNRFSPLVWDKRFGAPITLEEFKQGFAVWTRRRGFPQWLRNRPHAEERLRTMLHRESFAVTRDECFDLPARLDPVLIPVPLEESAPYYDKMAEEMVAYLTKKEFTWAKIPLVLRLRLSQLTSGIAKTEPTPQYPQGRLVRVGREKLRMLEDFAVDQFEADEKLVIGAQFRGDISSIRAMMRRLKVPCFELHGGVDRHERTRGITEFNKIDGAAVMLAQPAAASEGIDLRSASTLVWFSLTDSWVNYQQFEDRIALSGKACRYVYLLGQGTVDEVKYEGLQEDGDVARRITESPERLLRNFKNDEIYK